MELTPALQALIEQYLNGQLQGEALQAFEQRLNTDKALAKEIAFQEEMHAALAETPENELRKMLQQLNAEVREVQVAKPNKKWWSELFSMEGNNNFFDGLFGIPQLRLAGLAAVLLMISWWFSPLKTGNTDPPSIAVLPFIDKSGRSNFIFFL